MPINRINTAKTSVVSPHKIELKQCIDVNSFILLKLVFRKLILMFENLKTENLSNTKKKKNAARQLQ